MKPKKIKKHTPIDWVLLTIAFIFIVLIAWVIMCSDDSHKVHAQNPTVNTPVLVGTSSNQDNLLSIPRYKGLWSNGDTLYLFHAQNGASEPAWYYSINAGASWTAVTGNFENDGYLDYHSSFYFAKGIHGTATDDMPYYKRIRIDATHHGFTTADTVTRVNLSTASTIWYTNVIAKDTNDVWIFYRMRLSYEGIKYKHTANRWSTIDSGSVWGPNVIASNMRVGAVYNVDTPYVVMLAQFDNTNDGFYYSKWNGTVFDAPNDSVITKGAAYSTNNRAFAVAMVDSNLHLVFGDNNNTLAHFYQSDTGWFKDTISTSVMTNQVEWYPIIGKRGKALNVIYRVLQTADTAYQNLCYKRWTPTGGWDADSTIIVKDTRVKYSQTPPAMPDSVNWLPVWWDNNISHQIFYARIDFDTLPPPAFTQVINLVSKGETQVTLENINTGTVNVDSMFLHYDDDATLADSLGRIKMSTGFGSPDTIQVTGLTGGTQYWFWWAIWDDNGGHMTSAVTYTTDVPTAQQIRYRVRTRR